tara:strand:+ start:1030 stop:2076 length:1047 start_codon:yes stop_codon:yes gene_type:complete
MMSGFGTMKKKVETELAEVVKVAPPVKEEGSVPMGVTEPPKSTPSPLSRNPLEDELEALALMMNQSNVFCGLVGHENTGKTGAIGDAHMYNVAAGNVGNGDYEPDDQLWIIDFDGGGAACRSAHYNHTPNIRVWDPWVMQAEERTAYDYPATHDRLMKVLMFALTKAKEQNEDNHNGPRLKNLLITAMDLFDSVCINNMKIYDMETGAKDAIEASASAINKSIGWNWNIRSTRYHQVTAISRQLVKHGVNVFWETHLAPEVFAEQNTGTWRPKWEKQTDNVLNQILWFHKRIIRSDDGKETGEVRYEVEFYKSKTNPTLQGQSRIVFVTKKGEAPVWHGVTELREGVL